MRHRSTSASRPDSHRRPGGLRRVACALILIALVPTGAAAADAPKPEDPIRGYLDRTADWYRRVAALGQSPVNSQEVLFRDTVRQTSRQAVGLGFDFGRAEAALLGANDQTTGPATRPAGDKGAKLSAAAEAATTRVSQVQAQLDDLDARRGLSSKHSPPLSPSATAWRRNSTWTSPGGTCW